MADFFIISTRNNRNGSVEIYPRFVIGKSNDLNYSVSDIKEILPSQYLGL